MKDPQLQNKAGRQVEEKWDKSKTNGKQMKNTERQKWIKWEINMGEKWTTRTEKVGRQFEDKSESTEKQMENKEKKFNSRQRQDKCIPYQKKFWNQLDTTGRQVRDSSVPNGKEVELGDKWQ